MDAGNTIVNKKEKKSLLPSHDIRMITHAHTLSFSSHQTEAFEDKSNLFQYDPHYYGPPQLIICLGIIVSTTSQHNTYRRLAENVWNLL